MELGGTPTGLTAALPGLFAELAEDEGTTVTEIIAKMGSTGTASRKFEDLEPNTEYIAFAVGVDNTGKTINIANVITFKTLVDSYALTVAEANVYAAKIAVVPTNATGRYFVSYITKEVYDTEFGGKPDGLTEKIKTTLEELAAKRGVDIAKVIETSGATGESTIEFDDVNCATEYIAYAVGVDNNGIATSPAYVVPFTTKAVGPGPAVNLTTKVGDGIGNLKDLCLQVYVKSNDVVKSGSYRVVTAAELETAIAAGKTYDDIIKERPSPMLPFALPAINKPNGLNLTFMGASSDTKCYWLVKLGNANGETIRYISEFTAPAYSQPDPEE